MSVGLMGVGLISVGLFSVGLMKQHHNCKQRLIYFVTRVSNNFGFNLNIFLSKEKSVNCP